MSETKNGLGRTLGIVLAVLVATAIGAGIYLYQTTTITLPPAIVPSPTTTTPPPTATAAVTPPPARPDCLVPGPSPVLPRGSAASAEDMKIQHDAIQAFVKDLEAYQACYANKLDHAPADLDDKTRQAWVAEGNRAVDVAHALANAYAAQLKVYKEHNPNAPPVK
jgi:hypothetical protein